MVHGLWANDHGPWTIVRLVDGPWTTFHGPWTMVLWKLKRSSPLPKYLNPLYRRQTLCELVHHTGGVIVNADYEQTPPDSDRTVPSKLIRNARHEFLNGLQDK